MTTAVACQNERKYIDAETQRQHTRAQAQKKISHVYNAEPTVLATRPSTDWRRLYKQLVQSVALFNQDANQWEQFLIQQFTCPVLVDQVQRIKANNETREREKKNENYENEHNMRLHGDSDGNLESDEENPNGQRGGGRVEGVGATEKSTARASEEEIYLSFGSLIKDFLFRHIRMIQPLQLSMYLCMEKRRRPILYSFVSLFDFRDLEFDWALRGFLSSVSWLPPSSKGVDRLIHAFSDTYLEQNPSITHSIASEQPPSHSAQSLTHDWTDRLYILCYSLIMLSTNLYNHSVPSAAKMSQHAFVRMTHDQTGIARSTLGRMYESSVLTPMQWRIKSLSRNGWWLLSTGRNYLLQPIFQRVWVRVCSQGRLAVLDEHPSHHGHKVLHDFALSKERVKGEERKSCGAVGGSSTDADQAISYLNDLHLQPASPAPRQYGGMKGHIDSSVRVEHTLPAIQVPSTAQEGVDFILAHLREGEGQGREVRGTAASAAYEGDANKLAAKFEEGHGKLFPLRLSVSSLHADAQELTLYTVSGKDRDY